MSKKRNRKTAAAKAAKLTGASPRMVEYAIKLKKDCPRTAHDRERA
jgi:hypothetical protein